VIEKTVKFTIRAGERNITLANLAILAFATLVALAVCESVVRYLGETDENDQFFFGSRRLKPYRLPVVSTAEKVNEYLESTTSYLLYDPHLGWTLRPNSESDGGLYMANSAGLRSETEYDLSPDPGVVRIAIFGDSFTHGDGVPFEDTWGHRLEVLLDQQGLNVEVLNFGVPGYGMDQAFLRWQHVGRQFSPDIVVFGFQAENIYRNLNTIRPIHFYNTGVPFSKPRFVLDGEELRLVNSPAIPPEQVPETLARFAESPLVEYEYFYDKDHYMEHWWLESKLLALVLAEVERSNESRVTEQFYDSDGEPSRLAIAIIQAFKADVEAHGAQFVIVHLPLQSNLARIADGQPLYYTELLDHLEETCRVVHTEEGFTNTPLGDYFAVGHHYSAKGNGVIAAMVAGEIRQLVDALQETTALR
jgi:lysophospholipase L1-like esterase